MASPELNPPPDGMSQEVIDFRTRTVMPDEDVDLLWQERSGFLEAAIKGALADIYSRLRKRYKTPFTTLPEKVVQWIATLVTPVAYRARGNNPSDEQMAALAEERKGAYEEMKEAADSKDGLFDLPADDAADATAISKGGPLAYTEPSPYAWQDAQREAIRASGGRR